MVDLSTVKKTPEELSNEALEKHCLFQAAAWLEKHMHCSEQQYYRKVAHKREVSMTYAIVSDILGFFNVQETEITKAVKKNHLVINQSNLVHKQSNDIH